MSAATALRPYLAAGRFVDAAHPSIVAAAQSRCDLRADPVTRAVQLYNYVRDAIRYSPWGVVPDPEAFKASAVLRKGPEQGGHCIDKATLLAALARAAGIPARLHFANVRNHIGTEELERQLGTDLLVFHGYVELLLRERWVAATPAFNRGLCERLGVPPLQFDGLRDSVFQQYDERGGRFMEYVDDYGHFADIPYELMIGEWRRYYRPFALQGMWPRPHQGDDKR